MILDNLKNRDFYAFPAQMEKVFTFLETARDAQAGRYEFDGGIFVLVQEYRSKDKKDCRLEAHRKYADLQCIISGEESIGIAYSGQTSDAYNEEKDIEFFTGADFTVTLRSGDFALLLPQDLHRPGIGDGSAVKKAVVKIPVQLFKSSN